MCLVQLHERRLSGAYDIYFSLTCGLWVFKLIISKAGYTTFFERKNVESNDFEKLKQFFDKQNILWEKSICNIF